MTSPLPTHSEDELAGSGIDALVRTLSADQDRAPRNLIEHCARRGEDMLDALQGVLDKDYYWGDDQTDGEWWLRFHAVMILGLMSEARAGELLAAYLRRIDEADDDTLAEWLSGAWPALFRNKPGDVPAILRALAQDRSLSPYTRAEAADVAVASAQSAGAAELDRAIAWAAKLAFDDAEDLVTRSLVGSMVLNFARPEHRRKLEQLADVQPEGRVMFDRKEINAIYFARGAPHDWTREESQDPWAFYDPEQIEERQRQWAEADEELDDESEFVDEPYVRAAPKVGRNDPCPCGSGKKFKKCCGA